MGAFETYTDTQWNEILQLTDEFEFWTTSQTLAVNETLDRVENENHNETQVVKRQLSTPDTDGDSEEEERVEKRHRQPASPILFSDDDSDFDTSQVSKKTLHDIQNNVKPNSSTESEKIDPLIALLTSDITLPYNIESLVAKVCDEKDDEVVDIFDLLTPPVFFLKIPYQPNLGRGVENLVSPISVEQRFSRKFNTLSELMRLEIINTDEVTTPDWLERLSTQILETVKENFNV
ncbi:hypothetical protein SNE40_009612 [Patella caerulea]|uniref:Uncharacterized protein n=1 Tax=Patella caerulea TaxID=87958 RepID=A0AAN8Q3H7_PATCE